MTENNTGAPMDAQTPGTTPEQPQYASQQYVPQQQYAPQQQYVPQQQYAPQQASGRTAGIGSAHKDKWVAAVLAFALGPLGIHKFYLGYKTEGIIMILVSLIGGLCLGLGLTVMLVISIIEAVRYVILTQEDFEATYVQGNKGWL